MKRQIFALSFGLGAMILAAQHAFAQEGPKCDTRERVLEQLTVKFGETRQSIGLAPNNAVIEVFASTQTGSWTITATMPNGVTCLVASGQAFEALAELPVPPGNDA
jgi:hypothetical protein